MGLVRSLRHLGYAGLLGLALGAGRAQAHAVVVTSEPAAGAALAAPPARLIVRFNSRIDHGRSRLTLVGPDNAQVVIEPATGGDATVLEGPAPAGAWPAGAWRVRWQVLAVDGHITRGDIPFTLRAP